MRTPYKEPLPNGWVYLEIGDNLEESKLNNSAELPLLSVTRERGVVPQSDSDKRDISSSDKSKYKVINVGELVYNTMRMWQGVVALSQTKGIVSPAYTVLKPSKDVHAQFVEYLFKSQPMIKLFHRYSQGLVDDTLNLKYENLSRILMPIPPLNEQRKIADILTSVDNAISKTEAIIEQTEKVKKGLMQQLLTKGIGHTKFKHTEIGEIPVDWDLLSLGDLVKIQPGYAFKSVDFTDQGDRLLRGSNIGVNLINWDDTKCFPRNRRKEFEEYILNSGDVVIAMDRPFIGNGFKVARISENDLPALLLQRVSRIIQSERILQDFTYIILRSGLYEKQLRNRAVGMDLPHISAKDIGSPLIPVPPLTEQGRIASIINSIDDRLASDIKQKSLLETLKNGLMQVLLTGKVCIKVDEEEVVKI